MSEGAPVLGPIGGPLVEHALAYGAAGLAVFPVNPRDKTPLCSQHTASAARNLIGDWWERWPDALIGHRLPKTSIVTDIDPRHHGDDTWRALKDEIGELPVTRAHASGRGDGGAHLWWQMPAGRLNIRGLNEWARERDVGEAHGTRWTSGIDLLHHDHRYTILPPSPHPETGAPYRWVDGRGLQIEPAPMPALLVELLVEVAKPLANMPENMPPRAVDPDSIADWFSEHSSWASILEPHGWRRVGGDGEHDGSAWRHPLATSAASATVKHGCLFVYTPNTPFEPTEAGDAHGYTRFAAWAQLEHRGDQSAAARAARERLGAPSRAVVDLAAILPTGEALVAADEHDESLGPQPIDWSAFWTREHAGEDWLVHPILPRGRQVALWARHKTGKSLLTLEIAAALATGRGCMNQPAGDPIDVIYLDMEMTEDDLHERLTDLGYGPEDELDRLHYYLLPSLPALDTDAGGWALHALADRHQASAVVIDTMARVVQGDENDADTYRSFYRCTGMGLKARGISVLRLDHGGKDATKGQRGSSGKGDDVDVVWQLKPKDEGLELVRDVSRIAWVPDKVALLRNSEPLRHTVTSGGLYKAGTAACSKELQALGITSATSQRAALAAYKGEHPRAVVRDAHRYLKDLERRTMTDLVGEADDDF